MTVNSILSYGLTALCCLSFNILTTTGAVANDFPTIDRALFIEECMALENSRKYETLYACVCMVDKIAIKMSYKEYVEADSYQRMRNMRGERGGMFRSGKRARDIRKNFSQIKHKAKAVCFSQQVIPQSNMSADGSKIASKIQKR